MIIDLTETQSVEIFYNIADKKKKIRNATFNLRNIFHAKEKKKPHPFKTEYAVIKRYILDNLSTNTNLKGKISLTIFQRHENERSL